MLNICRSFFGYLNDHRVRYCHWKSNIRLSESLAGKTDLDLLVHPDDRGKLEEAIRLFDIKKILSPPLKRVPGIEDYLGFDYKTGQMIHLHVHYRLILGQKSIKNHCLPIEDLLLANVVWNSVIPVPLPEVELFLLTLRAFLKMNAMDITKTWLKFLAGHPCRPFPADIESELDHLRACCDSGRVGEVFAKNGLSPLVEIVRNFLGKISSNRLKPTDLIGMKMKVSRSLKKFRLRKGLDLWVRHLRLLAFSGPVVRKMREQKKTICGRGRIVAVVGADGSGKSTLVTDVVKSFSWKLSVRTYYYGIPKTIFVRIPVFLAMACERMRFLRAGRLLEALMWVYIARKRYCVFKKSVRDMQRGKVVVTDRFPLRGFRLMEQPMDGPRLRQPGFASFSRLAALETRYYDKVLEPDKIFALNAPIEVLRERRKNLDIQVHRQKAEAVNAVGNEKNGVAVIDASRTATDVLLEVKRKIWGML